MNETYSELFVGTGLIIFNSVDLIAGIALCIYSLYIGSNHYTPTWLYGSVLVVASIMSSCGLAFPRCSRCMALSSKVLGWIAVAELGLAVVIFTQGGAIDNFLLEHSHELKLR
ncbi:hypothetical protein PsorP6_006953 [Peronosclerospora sorghi]|uniref:Uncharacterized protein n=1 Tax=Peronosclerospora sorghi TaxID=230839 RepID=A0ACC0W8A5_9STRA|nr:hypothetical protein PsorP6_006953 [Peronosclerospora sorghi]